MLSQIDEIHKFMESYSFIDFLAEEFHQAFKIVVITVDIVFSQSVLEATRRDVAFLLEIDEIEVVCEGNSSCVDSLFCVRDVGVHISCQRQDLKDQL